MEAGLAINPNCGRAASSEYVYNYMLWPMWSRGFLATFFASLHGCQMRMGTSRPGSCGSVEHINGTGCKTVVI